MMKRKVCILICWVVALVGVAQNSWQWQGSANFELSRGIAGDAKDYGYWSVGVAGNYGVLINNHYFAGLGIKPNYIFSRDDYDGFFLPVYGEFKYVTDINAKQFGYYGLARLGYSPVDVRGPYAHLGGGLIYKRWEFGLGVSYQGGFFKEEYMGYDNSADCHLVFMTLSVGYRF